MAHLRFVASIAKGYMGYGLPMEDLVQEGSIGLMKSVKRFDLSYGVRFVTFAMHWIKSEIQEYVLRNWKLVKVATTKAQRKLFFNLRRCKKQIGWMSQDEKTEVAHYLGVKEEEVGEMEARLIQSDSYFDESFGESKNEDYQLGLAEAKLLEDHSSNPENILEVENFKHKCLQEVNRFVEALDERSKDILSSRWLIADKSERLSLKDLADKYAISLERVRQIEVKTLAALKDYLSVKKLKHE